MFQQCRACKINYERNSCVICSSRDFFLLIEKRTFEKSSSHSSVFELLRQAIVKELNNSRKLFSKNSHPIKAAAASNNNFGDDQNATFKCACNFFYIFHDAVYFFHSIKRAVLLFSKQHCEKVFLIFD